MRCKAAGKAIFEDGIGLLDPRTRIELGRHCDGCRTCRQARQASLALDDGFLALRRLPVPAVEIRQVVLNRIRSRQPAQGRGFAWALAAAATACTAFMALTLALTPHALPLLRAAFYGSVALIRSVAPVLNLGTALVQLGGLVTRPLLSAGAAFGSLEPLAWNILITGACAVVAAALVIVSRAFLQTEPAASSKES